MNTDACESALAGGFQALEPPQTAERARAPLLLLLMLLLRVVKCICGGAWL